MDRMGKVWLFVALALCCCTASARAEESSYDFPSCGTVVNRNQSYQFGEYAWLEYIVETVGVFDICGQWIVGVSAYVPGVANSNVWRQGLLYASAVRQVMVPSYGRWTTRGEHYTSGSFPNPFCCGGWWPTGNTASTAEVVAPRSYYDPEYECMLMGGTWYGYECQIPNCPILVDVRGDGYRLTSAADGVRFDLDADGAPELVAWTTEDSDDAFLAVDRNGNGRIDDGTELLGNHTPVRGDGASATAPNGFEALAFLESPAFGGGRPDNRIDANDSAFSRLLLWRDSNHNGVSEREELTPASAALSAIGTDYKERRRRDGYGNEYRQKGWLIAADGSYGPVYDVWLKWRQ